VGRRSDAFEHLTLDIDEEGGIEALGVQSGNLDFEVGAVGGINGKLALGLPLYILCLNQSHLLQVCRLRWVRNQNHTNQSQKYCDDRK
jgi:hypothetical protein